jgi:hypothetical protein
MDCLSSLLYIYYLSSYSYGGYPSYLLSTCTVFLSIRTGAIPPTYFLYVLSFSLFVRGLSLPLIFYMYLSFSLFVRGLSLLLTFYMYCLSLYSYGGYLFHLFSTCTYLSLYSYGGYPSYLLSTCTVFLSIRTGAIPPTYFRPGPSTLFMLLLSNLYSNTYSK